MTVSTGHIVLGLLSRGQRHGYDLKRAHDEACPTARPLAFGQVYAALDRLHRKGLIRPTAVERSEGPDRTVYELTDAGRAELETWIHTTEDPGSQVSNPLATKSTIALLAAGPETAASFLDEQRVVHLRRMRHHTKVKTDPSASVSDVLAADFAIAHLDADIRWMEAARTRIADLATEATS